jgi:hypothetical protein
MIWQRLGQKYLFFKILIRLFILILTFSISANGFCFDKDFLIKENLMLESELKLAKKPNIYYVFNLRDKNIQIKANGVLLKVFEIKKALYWGNTNPANPLVLVKKRSLIKPHRAKVKPESNKDDDTFELNPLELDDMPSRYTLVLTPAVRISVKPAGYFSNVWNVFSLINNSLALPFITFFYSVIGKPYTYVDIVLNKEDAKALYWSLSEGTGIILCPP